MEGGRGRERGLPLSLSIYLYLSPSWPLPYLPSPSSSLSNAVLESSSGGPSTPAVRPARICRIEKPLLPAAAATTTTKHLRGRWGQAGAGWGQAGAGVGTTYLQY